jgi:adenosylcobyric acid synthase
MNPVLIKPHSQTGAQVVVLGKVIGTTEAKNYWKDTSLLRETAFAAYDRLAARHDLIVIEGAGSPAEFNLRGRDFVNMPTAHHADAQVLIAGDIDKGGVFASFLGTWHLCQPEEQARIAGWIINRFRGDERLLEPAPADFGRLTGIPVRGVVPMRRDIIVDREDDPRDLQTQRGLVDVAVLRLGTISNFTDLELLAATPHVGLRWVASATELGNPDLLILPGSKDTIGDLRRLREAGLDRAVLAAARRQIPVLGLCGGYQLLGERLRDPSGTSGTADNVPGLGILPISTNFMPEKVTRLVEGNTQPGWLLPGGLPIKGYEIHQGQSVASEHPLVSLGGKPDGAIAGLVAGTYVHGFLDSGAVREALVNALLERRGLPPAAHQLEDGPAFRARNYEALADLVGQRLNLTGPY